jgi:3'-phosphoadenosine 5'-phosphosulfate sulfotransferase (PAPS reductase)/FAD synthetase
MLDELGHDRSRRILIHADLGRAEWRSTPATIERHARQLGLPLVVTRRTAGDMVARWEQRFEQGWELYAQLLLARLRGPWSSSSGRFCTAELKRDVLHQYLSRTYPGETIISVLGIRHQESPKRAKTEISKIDTKLSEKRGCTGILWHPSIHIKTEDVFEYHRLHGLDLHEAYTRYGASRLSCAYCVLASKADLRVAASVEANHDLYRHLVEIELRTGFSFQQGGWLADVAPTVLTEDQRLRLPTVKAYAAERRTIEAGISTEFLKVPKGAKWPVRMPTSDEARAITEARRLNAAWTGRDLPYLTLAAVNGQFARMISAKG